jgi:hypothetical protein
MRCSPISVRHSMGRLLLVLIHRQRLLTTQCLCNVEMELIVLCNVEMELLGRRSLIFSRIWFTGKRLCSMTNM